MTESITQTFALKEFKEFWSPANLMGIYTGYVLVQEQYNKAYTYCDFNAYFTGFAAVVVGSSQVESSYSKLK